MGKVMTTSAINCIDCYREELLIYLVQRFGSLVFARRVFEETQRRLSDSNIFDYVANPHIYLISYALSLGLEFIQADLLDNKQALHLNSASSAHVHPYVQQIVMTGGESWHSQPLSILH